MTMTKGTVTISDAGAVSGSGGARYVFDLYWPKVAAKMPGGLDTAATVGAQRAIAELCNDLVSPLIDYIKDNAVVDGADIT